MYPIGLLDRLSKQRWGALGHGYHCPGLGLVYDWRGCWSRGEMSMRIVPLAEGTEGAGQQG